jgi:N-sulfoglucosamine sulfohydrolase
MPALPNIVYIHSHDTGRYVQPYGYAVPTPNYQALAEQGILFSQAYSAAPTCSPSRACLLTGQWPHSSGMIGLAHRGFRLNDYSQHLVHTLRRSGYHSLLLGVQHVADDPAVIGYDEVYAQRSADDVAGQAEQCLRTLPAQPFFLDVGFQDTHRPFPVPDSTTARYCLPPAHLPSTPETRQDMAAFHASARRLDEGLGRVLAALDESGVADNTLVICTTDHGLPFPGMKCTLTGRGLGVLLIMRGPKGMPAGRVCDDLASHIDIFPTICDLIGARYPAWLQGTSLLPLLQGKRGPIRTETFAEVTYHAAYEPQRAIRTARWSYIRRFGGRRTPVLANCDDSPSKDLWLQHGWAERVLPEEELYDLVFDAAEMHNIATEPEMSTVKLDLGGRLLRWMAATNDPLLQGPVRAPQGARVNDPDDLSPSAAAPVAT